ncbi:MULTISPECIES: TetR/AcrR family transcriptional regulator [unclassified Microbacterium]|uniref:TetR/AcrR family transcriptional regulator n=1 Tax=unclassified Microbacterium TaxID=2609290 RepID=UPI000C2B9331|nr:MULTISPECIES: TetR/AcrR family transcriptional regulator [unclassified Microbacterium]
MNRPPAPASGLRAITREAVRERIAEHALILFDEKGFEQTTIEDIVTAVGISVRSYFRYYASKEDAVIGDLVIAGTQLRDNVARRLADQTPWRALHLGMRDGAEQIDAQPDKWLRTMRVIYSAASLRARNLEKHLAWSALLTPLIRERLEDDPLFVDLEARTLVGSAFACLDAALASWTETNAAVPFGDALDAAFTVRY